MEQAANEETKKQNEAKQRQKDNLPNEVTSVSLSNVSVNHFNKIENPILISWLSFARYC